MAFKEVVSLDCDIDYAIDGRMNKKTGKKNPTSIEGFFLGTKTVPGSKYGDSTLHVFSTPDGNTGIWGKTDLNRKLRGVEPGLLVRAELTGKKNTSNGEMYTFRVQVDKEQSIEVGGLETHAATESAPSFSSDDDFNQEFEDSEAEVEETALPPRAVAPKQPAQTPSLDQQAQVRALLSKRKA